MKTKPVLQSIPLLEPFLKGNAQRYLEECLEANYVSSVGPFVEKFESEFASYVGSRYAVACSSGTAAIHVAMRLVDINPLDEVFVPTLTFIASANPVLYERAVPVFVDSEKQTWNLDPELIVEEIERRARKGQTQPKAIEVVHLLGQPAQIEAIAEVCEKYGIVLIEDAAEALGARYSKGRFKNRHVGTIGKIGCFSFNGNKVITTGGGGMIVTDDERLARRAKHLTTQARVPGFEYAHDEVGYNYRLSNLAAALGLAQLECLPKFLEKKKQIAEIYDQALGSLKGLHLPPRTQNSESSYWLYTVLIEAEKFGFNRSELHRHLKAKGIETRPVWKPLHIQALFRKFRTLGGKTAEKLFSQALSLPCSVGLSAKQQSKIIVEMLGI